MINGQKRVVNLEIITKLYKAWNKNIEIEKFEELHGGFFNTAVLVKDSEDRETVIKMAPAKNVEVLRYEKEIMKREVNILEILKENIKIKTPRMLYFDNSKTIIDSDYFIMEKIHGKSIGQSKDSLNEEKINELNLTIGKILFDIHKIKSPKFGYFDNLKNSWKDSFIDIMDSLLQDGIDKNTVFPVDVESLKKTIINNAGYLEEVQEASLIYWDLWEENIFVDENGILTGIIDCERALWGDILMEVNFSSFMKNKEVMQGYGLENNLSFSESKRRLLYDLHYFIMLVVENEYRHYGENNYVKWGKSMLRETYNQLQ